MRLTWVALSLAALVWTAPAFGAETEAVEVGIKPGQRAPYFELATVAGDSVALADSVGSGPVVLSFWATWCNVCKKEMPKVSELLSDYTPKGVKFFAIDYRESAQKVAKTVKKWGIEATVLLDRDGDVSDTYDVQGIPTVVILDRKGVVQFYGYASRKKLAGILDDLL